MEDTLCQPKTTINQSKTSEELTGNVPRDSTNDTKRESENKTLNDTTKVSGIYKIVNKVNGKYYVGSSCDILTPNVGRWYKHRFMLKSGNHSNYHLQRAWNKFGEDSFDFKIVEICLPTELIKIEQRYLDGIKIGDSYNLSLIAGKIEMTDEIRKKIGKKSKERLKDKRNHPMFGRTHSDKTKKLIAKNSIRLGDKNGMFGKKHPLERILKMKLNHHDVSGKLNPRYNHKIYHFINSKTGEKYDGTKYEFCEKFGLKRTVPNDLLRSHIKCSASGWKLSI